MKKVVLDPPASMRSFERRAAAILEELQAKLLPKHGDDVIGINVETGEYVLASTSEEAWNKFRQRWPESLGYVVRVDGGPVAKFYGR